MVLHLLITRSKEHLISVHLVFLLTEAFPEILIYTQQPFLFVNRFQQHI